ncbi:RNA-directed DNA polymerase [Helicobacter sp. 23-1045]
MQKLYQNNNKRKNVLQLDYKEARDFFFTEKSYCDFDLPPYIKFKPLLKAIDEKIEKENIEFKNIGGNTANNFDSVNYKLFNNKNGKYDWRPFELINPFIYVYLVREITDEANWEFIRNNFKKLNKNSRVKCHSIPIKSQSKKPNKAEQITEWWEKVEQESIKYSLAFEYLFETDITNFYPSIYTHSIAWALHTKDTAKANRSNSDLGNKIDKYIMVMSYGQTNGIPQGSVLMDFIAEILLAYIDNLLSGKLKELNKKDFRIIRYRDDYRIFVNNPQIADLILKNLSMILAEMGLKLNPSKTIASQNVIQDSIKKDKVEWLFVESLLKEQTTLQKQLIIFHKFALAHQNSGTLDKILPILLNDLNQSKEKFKKERRARLFKTNLNKENIKVLVAILVDIASFNAKIYPVAMSILGFLLDKIKCKIFIDSTIRKLQKINNNAYMQIWLQRAIIKLNVTQNDIFDEQICKEVSHITSLPKNKKYEINLWNLAWLNCNELKDLIKKYPIIDRRKLGKLAKYAQSNEVNVFEYG